MQRLMHAGESSLPTGSLGAASATPTIDCCGGQAGGPPDYGSALPAAIACATGAPSR